MYFDVQTCTKSNPFFSCLRLWSGSLTRILYFEVQTGTKTNLSLVFHVYGVVLLLASCTLVYKRAPEQAYFSCLSLWDGAFTRILYFDVQTGTQSNHFFSCLFLWGGAFSRILYFDEQTGTKTNLFQFVYVHRMVLLLASCTLVHKRAPKQAYF